MQSRTSVCRFAASCLSGSLSSNRFLNFSNASAVVSIQLPPVRRPGRHVSRGNHGAGLAGGKLSRGKKGTAHKPRDAFCSGRCAEENPISAISCGASGLGNELPEVEFIQPQIILNTRPVITNRKFPSCRRSGRSWFKKFNDDVVEIAIFKPNSNTTLNCLPILHELIWIKSVLTNHLAQRIAQIITQKDDTVRTGKR